MVGSNVNLRQDCIVRRGLKKFLQNFSISENQNRPAVVSDLLFGKKTSVNQMLKWYDVNFPDFEAVKNTLAGLNKVFSTLGPNFPVASFNTINRGDSN